MNPVNILDVSGFNRAGNAGHGTKLKHKHESKLYTYALRMKSFLGPVDERWFADRDTCETPVAHCFSTPPRKTYLQRVSNAFQGGQALFRRLPPEAVAADSRAPKLDRPAQRSLLPLPRLPPPRAFLTPISSLITTTTAFGLC